MLLVSSFKVLCVMCLLQLAYLDQFFAANGSRSLLFYYERDHTDCRRESVGTKPSIKLNKHKLYITDGNDKKFTGLCVFFIRTTMKSITIANVAQEVCVHTRSNEVVC